MNLRMLWSAITILTLPLLVQAKEIPHKPSLEVERMMIQSNQRKALQENAIPNSILNLNSAIPFAEYNEVGYIIFSSDFYFNSEEVKRELLRNLPETVTAVVFTGTNSASEKERVKARFSEVISSERLKVVYLPRGDQGFWARDGIPVPLVKEAPQMLSLVDARYYYPFEADQIVAGLFKSPLISHDYYFEGGNFMANGKGDCLIVDKSATQDIPSSVFSSKYGCRTLLRLPHEKGIGHADESVKFISDDTVLTDTPSYIPLLQEQGFKVTQLPRPQNYYETYVNALIVENIVYLPIFDQPSDQEAIQIYESFGFQVIPLNTETLSNQGLGSIHCITMTYPPGPYEELLETIGASE